MSDHSPCQKSFSRPVPMTPPPAPISEAPLPITTSPDNLKDQNQNSNVNGSNSNYNDGLTIVPPSQPIRIVETGGPNNRYMKLNVLLGKGAYKTVWRAVDREEGIEVAWNCITVHLLFSYFYFSNGIKLN